MFEHILSSFNDNKNSFERSAISSEYRENVHMEFLRRKSFA